MALRRMMIFPAVRRRLLAVEHSIIPNDIRYPQMIVLEDITAIACLSENFEAYKMATVPPQLRRPYENRQQGPMGKMNHG